MEHVTITKTKQYLIFKIPLTTIQKKSSRSSRIEKVITEGLTAVAEGHTEGPFKSGRAAVAFLRSL